MRLIDFKSYVDPVSTGAILGAAGISAGGQVASGLFKPSLKRQWKYQQKQMKLQQQYALEQLQKQGEINYTNWQKQFDYENAYNDPSKVFDRYLKAGVTPAGVLGSSGVGVNATMSGGSAGSVGASGPSSGSFDFSSPLPPGAGSAVAETALDAMGINSTIERNKAAAARDEAEARSIDDQNVGNQLYTAMAKARVDLDSAIAVHNLAARDVLKIQEDIEKNNRFISDATLLSSVDEKKNQAALVAAMVKNLGIENDNLGKLMSAQAFMMNTQGALNQVLGEQAGEVIQSLRLDNLDSAFELSNNWDKKFDVEIPNPQYEKNLRSSNPVVRANPGPRSFKASMSLKDFHNKTVINQAAASEFLPEQARIALRNAKLDPYVEISKALIGVAGSVVGAGIIRGGMSRAAGTISAGGSSSSSAGSSLTTRYDSRGNVVGYAKTEMNRSGHSSTYGTTRKSR
nr:MAG TPA: DNA pilot protein VP2 [Microviridae sp.]